jgi:excisionase family DNA binding protein
VHSKRSVLVNIRSLSDYTGLAVRTLRTLTAARKIPYLKIGYRTVRFDLEKVDKALERFEVKAISGNEGRAHCKVSMEGGT